MLDASAASVLLSWMNVQLTFDMLNLCRASFGAAFISLLHFLLLGVLVEPGRFIMPTSLDLSLHCDICIVMSTLPDCI